VQLISNVKVVMDKNSASRKLSSVQTNLFLLFLQDALTATITCKPMRSISSLIKMTRSNYGGHLCGPSFFKVTMNRLRGGLHLYSAGPNFKSFLLSLSTKSCQLPVVVQIVENCEALKMKLL